MFHREFLWPTSAKWVQTLIFCIIVIRNGLNTKHSSHFWLNFTFLVQLLIFPLTGNDLCHSQPMPYSFIISNASHSMHCSSVEAYLLWKSCYFTVEYVDTCSHKPWIAWDILLVILSVTGNLCNKCPKQLVNKTAVIVIISMRSLVSIEQQSPRRSCDINKSNERLHARSYAVLVIAILYKIKKIDI